MYSRLLRSSENKSFFLFGPRGTGKTTWVKATFPDAVYIDLLESPVFNDLLAGPQRLEQFVPLGHNGWIIIDEIQRIPELLNEVHRLIENRKLRFILTGSGARKLRRQGNNLLAGRALTYALHPLTAPELGNSFNLAHSLRYGQLPCAYTESDPGNYLESYVHTYLEEEIRQEGITRNLAMFARFLEAASFSQAGVMSVSAIARDCAVERKTVENWFQVLEDLMIGVRVPVFTKKAKRRLVAHSKFYFFDTGVYRTIRPRGPLDSPEEIEGHAFETLLFQELRAVNDALRAGYTMYFWRTSTHLEVDFVLYGERGLLAFEVKRTGKVTGAMLSGLKSFMKDYPMARPFFVYGGPRRLARFGIDIVPLDILLKELPALLGKGKS